MKCARNAKYGCVNQSMHESLAWILEVMHRYERFILFYFIFLSSVWGLGSELMALASCQLVRVDARPALLAAQPTANGARAVAQVPHHGMHQGVSPGEWTQMFWGRGTRPYISLSNGESNMKCAMGPIKCTDSVPAGWHTV